MKQKKVYAVLMTNTSRGKAVILGIFRRYANALRMVKLKSNPLLTGNGLQRIDHLNFKSGVRSFKIQILKVNP